MEETKDGVRSPIAKGRKGKDDAVEQGGWTIARAEGGRGGRRPAVNCAALRMFAMTPTSTSAIHLHRNFSAVGPSTTVDAIFPSCRNAPSTSFKNSYIWNFDSLLNLCAMLGGS